MKINPLWNICLFIRILITVVIRIYYTNNIFKILAFLGLLVIGLGFTFKSLTGSNNEKQFLPISEFKISLIIFSSFLPPAM